MANTPQSDPPLPPPPSSPAADPTVALADPPPPYPSRHRRTQSNRERTSQRHNVRAVEVHTEHETLLPGSPQITGVFPGEGELETTPFLSPSSSRCPPRHLTGRPRSTSTSSMAPSLAHTVLSLFQTEDDSDDTGDDRDEFHHQPIFLSDHQAQDDAEYLAARRRHGSMRIWLSMRRWKIYFRPMGQLVYWKALFHVMVLNFPYALLAWLYLFVLTVTGTTLLMALPLGAVLCFFNLIGARALARGELFLQSTFHPPLPHEPHPLPLPPRPIFTRLREPSAAEIEAGVAVIGECVPEKSFYKNTYAMFTDSTSYQALFYFLVVKPAITILLTIVFLITLPAALVFIPTAPAALRAVRRIGRWQAGVAVEGLWVPVR